jgi:N-acetylglutamate synthase-like GNAT family acetyltransferase
MENVEICRYHHFHKTDVIKLIVEIQKNEFNLNINITDQPDLLDIESYYQNKNGNFWIAKIDNTIVGTISLLDIGNNYAALRKMFVKMEFRGGEFKVGQTLLNTLIQWAREKKVTKVFLGTTDKFLAAQRFYEKNNFITINKNQLPPTFPIMEVDVKFYVYIL